MHRRRFAGAIISVLGSASFAGCTSLNPLENESDRPNYPGGTLVVENTGTSSVQVSVTADPERDNASLNTTVASGETVVRREFVTAGSGDVVTLTATLGSEGEPIEFQFLPAGGDDDTPPEVARLSFENAVEASATWAATQGK
jgi:hypothetical protein